MKNGRHMQQFSKNKLTYTFSANNKLFDKGYYN